MFKKLSVFISPKLQKELENYPRRRVTEALRSALKFPTDLARELTAGLCEFSGSLAHIEYGRLLSEKCEENIALREAFSAASRMETTLYPSYGTDPDEIFTFTNFFPPGKKARLLVGIRVNFLPDGTGQIRGLNHVI